MSIWKQINLGAIILSCGLFCSTTHAGESQECVPGEACVTDGARLFHERCALCHGNDGLGEGVLPLLLGDYPNTNLLENRHGKSRVSLNRSIRHGGKLKHIDDRMPPWENELSAVELESVILFNQLLYKNFDKALAMLRSKAQHIAPSSRMGRGIFIGRCALCHGKQGRGDGKMARIIKNPPPFDLTKSAVGHQYLRDIIRKGGEAMGRSAKMPPWGSDLTENEISSVIMYLMTLRKK